MSYSSQSLPPCKLTLSAPAPLRWITTLATPRWLSGGIPSKRDRRKVVGKATDK